MSGLFTGLNEGFFLVTGTVIMVLSILTMSVGLLMSIIGTVMAVRNKLKSFIKLGLVGTIFLLAATVWFCWKIYLTLVIFRS